jgi:hypothetical protein
MVRTGAVRGVRIGRNGVAAVPGLRWDEPDLAFFGQGARGGNMQTTLFTLIEFELDILPCGGSHSGLLDGDPEKNHNNHRASRPQSRPTLHGVPGLWASHVRAWEARSILLG